jgi:hypothetical protein
MNNWDRVPKEIQEVMLQRQVEQGNKRDESVFERYIMACGKDGGVDWQDTPEGYAIWCEVLLGNYQAFYDFHSNPDPLAALPNLSEVKGVMCEVWDDGCDKRFVRKVVATSNSYYVVNLDYGAIQLWCNARPIPPKPKLTRKEVEDKYGIEVID